MDPLGRTSDYNPIATVLHDAPCLLCRASVRWLIEHDRDSQFRFVPLDSPEGRELLFDNGLEPAQADSVVLIHGGRAWLHSSAVGHALRLLGGRWEFFGTLLLAVPRPLRDSGYRMVARHRHLWPFGGVCQFPVHETPLRSRRELADAAKQRDQGTPARAASGASAGGDGAGPRGGAAKPAGRKPGK